MPKSSSITHFSAWRKRLYIHGLLQKPDVKHSFQHSDDLALLVGITLGDGHIEKFPRTERLCITLGTDKPDLYEFTANLVHSIFDKVPYVGKSSSCEAVRISLYQKYISERLEIPTGKRRDVKSGIPDWIWSKESYLLACIRGLFESDGCLCVHLPTCTYNFSFDNRNAYLLSDVYQAFVYFGMHPEFRPGVAVRLRKRDEVKYMTSLLSFRKYDAGWSNGSLVAL